MRRPPPPPGSRPGSRQPARPARPARPAKPTPAPRQAQSPRPQPSPRAVSETDSPVPRRRPSAFRLEEAAVLTNARQHARVSMWRKKLPFAPKIGPQTPLSMIVVVAATVLALLVVTPSLYTWYQQKQEYRDLHAQLIAAKTENESLQKQLKRWKDPEYITVEARRRLGYVRRGDTEYIVSDLTPKTPLQKVRSQARPWFLIVADTVEAAAQNRDVTSGRSAINTEVGVPAEGAVEHKEGP